ncbi:MAG: hypothetical protein PHV63_02720 [Candidatus Daviesbacteria bacterium]|nr:hypothetical protein [Candidatus Daviesbacteria bacterium]
MTRLTKESAFKLQRILSKRFGRELSETELEQAYEALMGFAEALIDLDTPETEPTPKPSIKLRTRLNHPIANSKESVLQYV